MDVFALFSDKTAEKVLLDSFPSRETEKGLVLKTTISSSELKESAVTSINNAYLILEKLYNDIPERIGICVYGFSSNVTGNSADLAFALAFLVHLAKKGIVKPSMPLPLSMAATGTITERLTVERIGNIREKLLAAVENKVEVVFYPYGNQSELDELKKSDREFSASVKKVNLIPIKSLEDILYEFGLLKECPVGVERKPAGRKLPIALLVSAAFCLAVFITFTVLNSGIPKKNYSIGLLDKTPNNNTSMKAITTPQTKTGSCSPTLSKTVVESTSKPETPIIDGDTVSNITTISPVPSVLPRLSQSEKEGIERQKSNTVPSSNAEINTVGNVSANLMNSGFVASQGDWIYFTDHINVGLYKMKKDGSSVTRLQNAFATHINVSGDGIYYLDTRSRGLFTIKADGSGRRKINDDNFGMIRVSGDWIYYLNRNDNLLYRVNKNGLDRTPLCNEFRTGSETLTNEGISCSHMCVQSNFVYFHAEFQNKPENNGIYRMKTDGSDKQLITGIKCDMLTVEDDYIYFVASSDSGLYKIKTNGTGKEKIHDRVKTFNLSSGLIYFSTDDGLFKMNYIGDFISKLSNDPTGKINIASGWIYYFNSNDANRLYRIRPNGTDKQSIGK